MRRVPTIFIIALFAVAAVEFGLLGANAAGLTGGGHGGLPPVAERLGVVLSATPTPDAPVPTPTPCLVAEVPCTPVATATADLTPDEPASPPPLSPPSVVAGITIIADPLAIQCDGSQSATVRVRILDLNGDPVPDGVNVYFEPYNGDADPYSAQTVDGYAETTVRFYDDIFPYGPNLLVHADLLQAGIRILCFPQSDECGISPPSDSPPCVTPTFEPPSPPPCDPSPPSEPLSPPCATPTPECPISPPNVSPPCGEPTPPVSPPPGFELHVDCDLTQPGIQSYCDVAAGANLDAGVVLLNNSGNDSGVSAFNFVIDNSDISVLAPLPGFDNNWNGNPDFNDASIIGDLWACTPPPPSPDTVPGGPNSTSFLSCYTGSNAAELPNGQSLLLATVHYVADPGLTYGYTHLQPMQSFVGDGQYNPVGECAPVAVIEMPCIGADINVYKAANPSSFDMQIDCDPAQPGIQPDCAFPANETARDVDVHIVNTTADDVMLAAFNFTLRGGDTTRLSPLPGADYNLNGNPDFIAAPEPNTWTCLPPPPVPDTGQFGPGVSASSISCYDAPQYVPAVIPAGGSLRVATVHYEVPAGAQPGAVSLEITDGWIYDRFWNTLGTCTSIVYYPQMACDPAAVELIAPPTPTTTPTGPRCADVNGDGLVSITDLRLIAQAIAGGQYDERYDINRSGTLGLADLLAAAGQFGRRC